MFAAKHGFLRLFFGVYDEYAIWNFIVLEVEFECFLTTEISFFVTRCGTVSVEDVSISPIYNIVFVYLLLRSSDIVNIFLECEEISPSFEVVQNFVCFLLSICFLEFLTDSLFEFINVTNFSFFFDELENDCIDVFIFHLSS